MAVSDALARTTARIKCSNADGRTGIGTSFYYAMNVDGENHTPLLITNRHVVDGYDSAELTFSLAKDIREASPENRRSVNLDDLQSFVVYHPNPDVDLAAVLLGPIVKNVANEGTPISLNRVTRSALIDAETETQMRFVEDVLVVGYPQGIWDEHRNLPIFRTGITASPAIFDYNNEPKFLIDCSIYPGSSGSPVFLYNSGVVYNAAANSTSFGERAKLLGVVSAVLIYQANGEVVERTAPTALDQLAVVGVPNNLGVVVKAREILGLEEAVDDRIAQLKNNE